MIPIVLDPKMIKVALIGRGEAARRRLALLEEAGVPDLAIFSDLPEPGFSLAAGDRLRHGLPAPEDLALYHVVWLADLPLDLAAPFAAAARACGTLINVEDAKPYCDFHNPALVRRGDLLLTVSTNGQSPGLAARIRRKLADSFGPEWADRLRVIGRKRTAWKGRARPIPELARLTNATIDANGWLPNQRLEA